MNIVIFTDTYLPHRNGVAYSIERQARVLRMNGHSVSVVGPSDLDAKIKIDTKCIFVTKDRRYKFIIPMITINQLSKKIEPEMIHIHTPFSIGVLGLIYARKFNIPVIYTHHTDFSYYFHYIPWLNNYFGRKLCYIIYKWFLNCQNIIITPSKHSKSSLTSVYNIRQEDIQIIPTPVNMIPHKNRNCDVDKAFDLVFVGRISSEKNILMAEKAIKEIITELPNTKIAIIGDGIAKPRMMLQLGEYLDKNIEFLGELDNKNVFKKISMSRFLIFTSVSETQGLVIQEAWANGVPVICVYCDLTNEYITDGKNGWISENSAKEFSKKTCFLLKSNSDAKPEISINCHKSAEEFSYSKWYKSYAAIMNEVLLA